MINRLLLSAFLAAGAFAWSPVFAGDELHQDVSAAPDPLAPLPKLVTGQARLFFFRKPQFASMAADARIALDGVTSGWVGGGSAVFVDHPSGKVTISIGGTRVWKGLTFDMTLDAGKEYFIGLAAEANIVSASSALAFLVTAGMDAELNRNIPSQYCGMDWCAAIFEKNAVLPTLTKLSISGPNPNAN